jgi:hypothetical protein
MENTKINALPESILVKNQKKQIVKHFKEDGEDYTLFINLRFDDDCRNGHNSFAITGSLYSKRYTQEPTNENYLLSYGCIHDDIIKHSPELDHLIKWHLCSTDGPMHYISDTLFHAGDLDCWGKKKGDPYNFTRKLKFDNNPFLYKPKKNLLEFIDLVGVQADWKDFKIVEIEHKNSLKHEYQYKPKYSFNGMNTDKWHEAPFDTLQEVNNFVEAMTNCKVEIISEPTSYGDGKERDLKAARNCAIEDLGLELSDEQLMLPKEELKQILLARLPELMQRFKSEMEKLGFIY